MRQYGQNLFSQLWTAPRVRIMFEKNADLLSDVADVPGDPNVRDWAMETLRLVQNADQPASFDPTSIPAYTKDGFERVQRLKLTADEAQFASQFNGGRSVQQIAKNLRLDLKSAQQLLFRFLAVDAVDFVHDLHSRDDLAESGETGTVQCGVVLVIDEHLRRAAVGR